MSYLRRTFVHLFIDLFIVGLIATLYVSNTPIDPAIWSRRSQETAGKVVQETVGNLGNLRPALVSLFVTLSTLGFTAILKQVWHWTSQETTTGAVQVTVDELGSSMSRADSLDSGLGIKQLAPGISPGPVVDIVAIHGLNGHRETTWTAENGVLWLRDLLVGEVPAARILTYGYDANIRGKEQLTSQTLYDHAETFIAKFALFRKKTHTENRPIIFVAHSLGGIMLKYVLIQANSATRNHLSDHRAIALSTYGIIYLGTPHQGAAGIDVALLLLRIQSIYSQTNKALVKHLQKDSELLRVQLSLYASISGNFDTKFFEAYPTRILGGMQKMLVPKSSAVVPGTINVEAIAINKDHVGMTKFLSSKDEDFQTICGHIGNMVNIAPQKIAEKWRLDQRVEGCYDIELPYHILA